MAPQAARFHQEANRYDELAREATTDRMRSHLLRLAHHYRSIAEELEPLPGATEPPLESKVLSFRTAAPAAYAGAKPPRTTGTGSSQKGAAVSPEQRAREQRIRERAYAIWERAGRPHGRDRDHWRQAERELAADADG
jgi:DUF2934 family protein